MGRFEYFDHSADVGIQAEGHSLVDLLCTAGRALMEWMGPVPETPPELMEEVHVEAEDLEELLVRWLQELLYLFHQKHAYFEDAPVMEITIHEIKASVVCRPWKASSAPDFQEVKAVTYHQVQVRSIEGVWRASVILDV